MALTFDDKGLLPSGIHPARFADFEEHFGGFQKSDRRISLLARLSKYVAAVRQTQWKCSLLVNGSFVMKCIDEPEDIDLVLVLPADWDMAVDLPPYLYNLVSKRRVKQEYGLEAYVAVAGSEAEQKWIEFFQQVNIKWCRQFRWPVDSKKGIVRVEL